MWAGWLGPTSGRALKVFRQALDASDRVYCFRSGSVRSHEMVADFSDKKSVCVPLKVGAYTAAALLQAGAICPNVLLKVRELEIKIAGFHKT